MSLITEIQNNTIAEEYAFERVLPAHYPLLLELYSDAFNAHPSLQEINKRFNTTNLGCELIGFIAIHKKTNEPAAYYGVFPHQAIAEEKVLLVAQSGDTMTHSAHRKKGLFVILARLTYKECLKNNISIIYGFPNENSYPGFIKHLDWKQLDTIIRYDLKLSFKTFPLSKLSKKFNWIKRIHLKYAKWLLRKKINNQVYSFQNNYSTSYTKVLRDKNYLEYKQSADKFFLTIENVIVWIRLTDVIWIGDFDNYAAITPQVLRKLKQVASWLGYNTIVFNFNESLPLPEQLKGFKKNGKDASCFYVPDNQSVPANFIFTGADFDTW